MARFVDIDSLGEIVVTVNGEPVIPYWALKDMEGADVKPVTHARWISWNESITIPLDEEGDVTEEARCSNCGDWLTASDEYATRGYYCPNCGAKMDEVVDDG